MVLPETAENLPYWKSEEPEVLINKALQIKYYGEAGALQLTMRGKDNQGNSYNKKGVNLRKHILQKHPELLRTLAEIFTDWYDELPEDKKAKALEG
ncbi:hypothetical protein [Halothermothrix orenii]|uniref:Uncharacterized protein n=1 Tax=Halothermothrix orenii (strain H 168 / OCM 544 / DSM 9562) TaxID=373903 RepID=B8D1N8_HALOH|nr:hypothetical protein [Halothermothrix orenii]ACL69115.1 hypothetical protein Hore_03540 [Halothermothrix orenii H 168]